MELKTNSKAALLFNVIYILRRLLIAVLALMLPDSSYAQVQIMILHCVAVIIYTAHVRPFELPLLNNMEIFNEMCILVASYHLLLFTDYV